MNYVVTYTNKQGHVALAGELFDEHDQASDFADFKRDQGFPTVEVFRLANAPSDPPQVVIEYDDDDRLVGLQCPKCRKTDIREYDRAERWNMMEIVNDGLSVSQGQADFETVNLICADCHTELGAPIEIFERMSWS